MHREKDSEGGREGARERMKEVGEREGRRVSEAEGREGWVLVNGASFCSNLQITEWKQN